MRILSETRKKTSILLDASYFIFVCVYVYYKLIGKKINTGGLDICLPFWSNEKIISTRLICSGLRPGFRHHLAHFAELLAAGRQRHPGPCIPHRCAADDDGPDRVGSHGAHSPHFDCRDSQCWFSSEAQSAVAQQKLFQRRSSLQWRDFVKVILVRFFSSIWHAPRVRAIIIRRECAWL